MASICQDLGQIYLLFPRVSCLETGKLLLRLGGQFRLIFFPILCGPLGKAVHGGAEAVDIQILGKESAFIVTDVSVECGTCIPLQGAHLVLSKVLSMGEGSA